MSALIWLTIPLAALVLAVLWVAWTSRERPRADTHETIAAHRRFREALRPRDVPNGDDDATEPGTGRR